LLVVNFLGGGCSLCSDSSSLSLSFFNENIFLFPKLIGSLCKNLPVLGASNLFYFLLFSPLDSSFPALLIIDCYFLD